MKKLLRNYLILKMQTSNCFDKMIKRLYAHFQCGVTFQDEQLTRVGEGVEYLKNMAVDMGRVSSFQLDVLIMQEIEMQGVMINELDKKMDDTTAQLNNLNRRLKNTLQKVFRLFSSLFERIGESLIFIYSFYPFFLLLNSSQVRSADRFCIDIILLIIILAIGGYIYNVVRNSK